MRGLSWFRKQTSYEAVQTGLNTVFPRLSRYCLVLTGDRSRADDLAQTACLHALEKAHLFEVGTHLDRWLFRLTQRLWISELRKRAVREGGGLATLDEAELIDARPDPERSLLEREVLMSVMQLPEAQRVTMLLVYVEGYSYRDAAEVLDIPVGTIMSRLSVARKAIASLYRDESKVS